MTTKDIERLSKVLEAEGHEVTRHNLECAAFAEALQQMGGADLLDTVCYTGSLAQRVAEAQDKLVREAAL